MRLLGINSKVCYYFILELSHLFSSVSTWYVFSENFIGVKFIVENLNDKKKE